MSSDDGGPDDVDIDEMVADALEGDIEPPDPPEPPEYDEYADVETWQKANLEYPVPGGWSLEDHGKFHTKWEHDDGSTLTRNWRVDGPDTYGFRLDGEEVFSGEAAPDRQQMRENTVWLLKLYDEYGPMDAQEFRRKQIEVGNTALEDFSDS